MEENNTNYFEQLNYISQKLKEQRTVDIEKYKNSTDETIIKLTKEYVNALINCTGISEHNFNADIITDVNNLLVTIKSTFIYKCAFADAFYQLTSNLNLTLVETEICALIFFKNASINNIKEIKGYSKKTQVYKILNNIAIKISNIKDENDDYPALIKNSMIKREWESVINKIIRKEKVILKDFPAVHAFAPDFPFGRQTESGQPLLSDVYNSIKTFLNFYAMSP